MIKVNDAQVEKFMSSFEKSDGCWNWNGKLDKNGYPMIGLGKNYRKFAHRLSVQLFKGPLIDGLVVDHVCRNRKCVNPDHLRQVDQRTNVFENSNNIVIGYKNRSYCLKGHEFTRQNTSVRRGKETGRRCLECQRERDRKRGGKKKRLASKLSGKNLPIDG